MLRRLALRDVVIVPALELEFADGFSVLSGETGAGKSILIDALQLALGARAEAGVVREGATRAEVSAEFDLPDGLIGWLQDAGLAADEGTLLLRRTVDTQGRSRAFVNGSAVTVAQLRELAGWLVDIHGQHAWQGLTDAARVRALVDAQAGIDLTELGARHAAWQAARRELEEATDAAATLADERDRLAWQLAEIDKLGPSEGEWDELDAEHRRLSHAQALREGAAAAHAALEGDDRGDAAGANAQLRRALEQLEANVAHDATLEPFITSLRSSLAEAEDAAHSLRGYLDHAEMDPSRLAALDERMGSWLGLARRHRRPPAELAQLRGEWQARLERLQAAADLEGLARRADEAQALYRSEAARISKLRRAAAGPLGDAVTAVLPSLGMAGGRFEVHVDPQAPALAHGSDAIELRVAGHAGATPRALAKVASGGELSRLALAIVVATLAGRQHAPTLIFDEIDAGIGGAVGDAVGQMMRRIGAGQQVLAITHLAQVAAAADHQHVVAKATAADGRTVSKVEPVEGDARVAEIARMLGGDGGVGARPSATSLAHAASMLQRAAEPAPLPSPPTPAARRRRSATKA